MTNIIPQTLIEDAENKATEWQMAGAMAKRGCPPTNWISDHPCEFGVFQRRNDYAVAPLFPSVLADMSRDGFRCVYRTDQ